MYIYCGTRQGEVKGVVVEGRYLATLEPCRDFLQQRDRLCLVEQLTDFVVAYKNVYDQKRGCMRRIKDTTALTLDCVCRFITQLDAVETPHPLNLLLYIYIFDGHLSSPLIGLPLTGCLSLQADRKSVV